MDHSGPGFDSLSTVRGFGEILRFFSVFNSTLSVPLYLNKRGPFLLYC